MQWTTFQSKNGVFRPVHYRIKIHLSFRTERLVDFTFDILRFVGDEYGGIRLDLLISWMPKLLNSIRSMGLWEACPDQ